VPALRVGNARYLKIGVYAAAWWAVERACDEYYARKILQTG
jgi:hypothetical protein